MIFSVIFIAATIWLSLSPNKLVDRIGKVLTPAFGRCAGRN
ncbi:branched-chain amino acid transport system II carrier protein [Corynebacterium pseudodiphtheriticum]|nr:branched-chain amino acid transport system II carrier protein [Corynebacterium pseudodiphtheriticum]UQV59172.1 branched-chain amino acid transport system II carrier protein [Corynebacterium pseudodiphtheriticum]